MSNFEPIKDNHQGEILNKYDQSNYQDENTKEKWIIELRKGDAIFHRETRYNMISTTKFSLLNFIVKSIFLNFRRFGNLFFLIISLIQLINPDLSPFYRWINIFPLLFYLCINWIKYVYLDHVRRREDQKINLLPARKGKPIKGGIQEDGIKWKDIEVGDIIQLRKDEICPADIVLIDTALTKNKENVCYLETQRVNGRNMYSQKKALRLTKLESNAYSKDKYEEFRKKLTGKLEYECPNDNVNTFHGIFKLKKDPRPEIIDINNLVLRGSILRNTEWVYGICVYVGHDTKMMQNALYTKEKRSYFEKLIQKFFLFVIILVLIMSVISTVIIFVYNDEMHLSIKYKDNQEEGMKIFFYLILYSPTIPISLYGSLDIIILFQKWRLQQIFKKNKDSMEYLKVMDPNIFANMGQVEYCFLDKSGTLTTGNFKVSQIYANQKIYTLEGDQSKMQALASLTKSQIIDGQKTREDQRIGDNFIVDVGGGNNNSNQPNDHINIEDSQNLKMLTSTNDYVKIKDDIIMRGKGTPPLSDKLILPDQAQNCINLNKSKDSSLSVVANPSEDLTLLNDIPFGKPNLKHDNFISPRLEKLSESKILDGKSFKKSGFAPYAKSDYMLEQLDESDSKDRLDQSIIELKKNDASDVMIDKDFMNDYYRKEDPIIHEILTYFTICHAARTKFINKDYVYESASPEELAVLHFAKSCGKSFEKSNRFDNPTLYTIKDKNEKKSIKILGVNDFSYPRRRFSIVLKQGDNQDQKVILLAKGPDSTMRDRLIFEDEIAINNFDKVIEKFKKEGLKIWVFGKRILTETETVNYLTRYQNCKGSLYSQFEDLDKLSDDVEQNLQLMTIVAMKDDIRPKAIDCIQSLKEANIKCWLLTGDSYENAINVATKTKIIDKPNKIYTLHSRNQSEVAVELRNILSQIKKVIDETTNETNDGSNMPKHIKTLKTSKTTNFRKSVVVKTILEDKVKEALNNPLTISGDTLDILLKNKYLTTNFAFICYMCSSVIGYNLTPSHKKKFIKLVKKRFIHRPITLAIGDGLNDALMFQTADISIELQRSNELLPTNAADIKIRDFEVIKELLFIHGRNFANKTENVILYLFYKAIALGIPLFFFNWYSSFSGSSLQDSMFIFLNSFLFTFFPIIIYGGFDKSEPEDILRELPALYIDGRLSKMRIYKSFGILSIIEGLIHSVIIFYMTIYCINDSYGDNGDTTDFGMISLVATFSTIVITNLKVIRIFKRYTILCLSLIILSVALLIAYIPINQEAKFVYENYSLETTKIFAFAPSIITLIFIIITSYATTHFISKLVISRFFPTLFERFISEDDNLIGINNSLLLKKINQVDNFSSIVKGIYKQPKYMDPIVQEMLSPADEDINAMSMKKFSLRFIDRLMEKHFRHLVAKSSIKYSKFVYYLFLLIFGLFTLIQYLINQDDVYGYSRLGIFIGFGILGVILIHEKAMHYYEQVVGAMIFLAIGAKIVLDWCYNYDTQLMSGLVPIFTTTIFNVNALLAFALNILYYILFLIRIIILYAIQSVDPDMPSDRYYVLISCYIILGYILIIGGISFFCNLLGHHFEKQERNEHVANAKLEIQLSKSNDILCILLPKFVKDKLDKMNGPLELAEDQGEVTVLFCDILNFDTIIKTESTRIVGILDYIFRKFDELCTTYGIQKIETVGKTYMGCAGLKSCEVGISKKILAVEPTKRIINMGFAMLSVIEQIKYNNGTPIQIKIGINYGRVIAGVIGYHKPQFSLIGDTVNTASRMCSTGKSGKINISESAKKMLKGNDFLFVKHLVEAKGLGHVPNYVVEKKIPTSSKLLTYKEKTSRALEANKRLKLFLPSIHINETKVPALSLSSSSTSLVKIAGTGPIGTIGTGPIGTIGTGPIGAIGSGTGTGIIRLGTGPIGAIGSGTVAIEAGTGPIGGTGTGVILDKSFIRAESILNSKSSMNPVLRGPNWNNLKNMILVNRDKIAEALYGQKHEDESDEDLVTTRNLIKEEDEEVPINIYDDEDKLNPNKILLTFSESEIKKAEIFESDLLKKKIAHFKGIIWIFLSIYTVQTFTLLTIRSELSSSSLILALRALYIILQVIVIIFNNSISKPKTQLIAIITCLLYGMATLLLQSTLVNIFQLRNLELLELMLLYLVASQFSGINFLETLILSFMLIIAWLIIFGLNHTFTVENIFYFCSFLGVNIIHSYIYRKHEIQFYNNLQTREKKKMEQKDLVSQLLPLHCIEKYFNDPSAKLDIQDEFENVTLLFADIKGFTEYSNSVSAPQVVKMLSELFTRFDKMCLRFSVYKVYTIGDCYVALGFIDSTKRDYEREAVNMVRMAQSMINIIKEVRARINFHQLNMRIGIHTGRIIGGIIGTDIVRYDIYGPDVLIANKMESNGVEGNINVSEDTKYWLEKARPDYYVFTPHTIVKSEALGIKKQSYLLSVKQQGENNYTSNSSKP